MVHAMRRVLLSSVIVTCLCSARVSLGEELSVDEIKRQASNSARLLQSMEYAYEISSVSNGFQTQVSFYAEGTRFRVNRRDVQGTQIGSKQAKLKSIFSAFDGREYQHFEADNSLLRLKDGNKGAQYSVDTPHTHMYMWLRTHGSPSLRWDLIYSDAIWDDCFANAQYVGKGSQAGVEVEIVDFPRLEAPTPWICRVSFAPKLGYAPLKYVGRIAKTGQAAYTMEVARYRELVLGGKDVAFPLEVTYQDHGADGVSLKQELLFSVKEESIKVNHDISDAFFTLDKTMARQIYDMDEQERLRALAR